MLPVRFWLAAVLQAACVLRGDALWSGMASVFGLGTESRNKNGGTSAWREHRNQMYKLLADGGLGSGSCFRVRKQKEAALRNLTKARKMVVKCDAVKEKLSSELKSANAHKAALRAERLSSQRLKHDLKHAEDEQTRLRNVIHELDARFQRDYAVARSERQMARDALLGVHAECDMLTNETFLLTGPIAHERHFNGPRGHFLQDMAALHISMFLLVCIGAVAWCCAQRRSSFWTVNNESKPSLAATEAQVQRLREELQATQDLGNSLGGHLFDELGQMISINSEPSHLDSNFDFCIWDQEWEQQCFRYVRVLCHNVTRSDVNIHTILNGCEVVIDEQACSGVHGCSWRQTIQFRPSDGVFEFVADMATLDAGYLTLAFSKANYPSRKFCFPPHFDISCPYAEHNSLSWTQPPDSSDDARYSIDETDETTSTVDWLMA